MIARSADQIGDAYYGSSTETRRLIKCSTVVCCVCVEDHETLRDDSARPARVKLPPVFTFSPVVFTRGKSWRPLESTPSRRLSFEGHARTARRLSSPSSPQPWKRSTRWPLRPLLTRRGVGRGAVPAVDPVDWRMPHRPRRASRGSASRSARPLPGLRRKRARRPRAKAAGRMRQARQSIWRPNSAPPQLRSTPQGRC